MARRLNARSNAQVFRVAVAMGAALYGTITVGGRWFHDRGFSLYEISLTGTVFGTLALGALLLARPHLLPRRRDLGLFVAFGLAGAALQLTQFAGIVLGVPVATVALLLYTQPVWTVLIGRGWLLEPITRRKLVALAVSFAGVLVLLDVRALAGARLLGVVAALVAGFFLALWVVLARVSALRGNPPPTTTFGYLGTTTLALLIFWPLARWLVPVDAVTRIDPALWLADWPAVALYTVAASLLPAVLVMWGMRGVEASTAGVLLLLEPVTAALLAWPMFGEALTARAAFGGALVLGANWVLLRQGDHEPER